MFTTVLITFVSCDDPRAVEAMQDLKKLEQRLAEEYNVAIYCICSIF